MDYKSLQALAKDMGVSAAGKAEDIIARIAAAEVDVPESGLTEEERAIFDAGQRERAAERAAGDIAAGIAAAGAAVSEDGTATAENIAGYLQNLANEERAAGELAEKEAAEKAAAGRKAGEDAAAAAGLVTVRAVTRFLDRRLNQIKDAGEAYKVSVERAAELAAAGVAEIEG